MDLTGKAGHPLGIEVAVSPGTQLGLPKRACARAGGWSHWDGHSRLHGIQRVPRTRSRARDTAI
jgi:hypothetical protein